ncbi:thiamine pyrophosphate-binding protein [Pectobacterium brasiliense]|uniref:thiamine pyrophosphate-binding protein n=1 Tax=Pectobacterium brasiliense TaxID=180957 RepID=UPI0019D3CA94|nr:thiamine pyrophosphate-binding protein [Pectobacterium brasiliense]MBN7766852.1 thiamine pyrophosphate-binding protein [Pectobacterium brasiliense]
MKITIACDFVDFLEGIGVDTAFGVSGGYIVPIWQALSKSKIINVIHCRHESGGAFSASEYSLCYEKPAVVFATAGPGITNSLTGLKAAKLDGAKVIFISAITKLTDDGCWGLQATTGNNVNMLVQNDGQGYLDNIFVITDEESYLQAKNEIAHLTSSNTGYVIGVFIMMPAQSTMITKDTSFCFRLKNSIINTVSVPDLTPVADSLIAKKTLFWIGFGSRAAAKNLKEIIDISGSGVISTPRGKGIISEYSDCFIGSTGLGSDTKKISDAIEHISNGAIIIIGTRLGEFSSSYIQRYFNDIDVFYVGLETEKVKNNLPSHTVFIKTEVKAFSEKLLIEIKKCDFCNKNIHSVGRISQCNESAGYYINNNDSNDIDAPIDPLDVMKVIQKIAIDKNNCYVAAEAGNSFCWANRYLKFSQQGRYRVSTTFGAMGHYASGLVGIAAGRKECAIGIIGDGSMLMSNEVSTAVRYGLPAIWLVMNDSSYNMCRQGLEILGNDPLDCEIPLTDFSLLGQSLGADGYRVLNLKQLEQALANAIWARRPAVIDIQINKSAFPPHKDRFETLRKLKNEP